MKYIIQKELSKKEFKKIENPIIIGETTLKKKSDSCKENSILLDGKEYILKDHVVGFKRKYYQIDEHRFVILKRKYLILILFVGLLLSFIIGIHFDEPKSTFNPIITAGKDIFFNQEENLIQEKIEIPGLSEEYKIDADNPNLYLINPKSNDVYFKYKIVLENKVIYESDYVLPNKMVDVNLYHLLNKGKHPIDVRIETIDIETQKPCNSAILSTVIKVEG